MLGALSDDPDPDVDFTHLMSEKRLSEWPLAASIVGWSFPEFVCITLDRAAREIERTAAA